jgi:hypothetical protein
VKRESISCLFQCSSHFQVIIRYLFNCEFHHTVYFCRTTLHFIKVRLQILPNQTNFKTVRRKTFLQTIALRWWCRRLHLLNNKFFFEKQPIEQHFKLLNNNLLNNNTAGCCSIREKSLPTLVLTLMFQHGDIILLSSKGTWCACRGLFYILPLLILNLFDIFYITCSMSSYFSFLRAGLSTEQPSLYFFFTNGMRI